MVVTGADDVRQERYEEESRDKPTRGKETQISTNWKARRINERIILKH